MQFPLRHSLRLRRDKALERANGVIAARKWLRVDGIEDLIFQISEAAEFAAVLGWWVGGGSGPGGEFEISGFQISKGTGRETDGGNGRNGRMGGMANRRGWISWGWALEAAEFALGGSS